MRCCERMREKSEITGSCSSWMSIKTIISGSGSSHILHFANMEWHGSLRLHFLEIIISSAFALCGMALFVF